MWNAWQRLPVKHGMNQEKLKMEWNWEANPRKTQDCDQLQQKQTKMVTKKIIFFYSKQSKLHTSNNKK